MTEGNKIWVKVGQTEPTEVSFQALDSKGKELGTALLFQTRHAEFALMGYVNTKDYGGKGSGASLELIKARVHHAFEKLDGIKSLIVNFTALDKEKMRQVRQRYEKFGFSKEGASDYLLILTRENYERLKEKGTYAHNLIE